MNRLGIIGVCLLACSSDSPRPAPIGNTPPSQGVDSGRPIGDGAVPEMDGGSVELLDSGSMRMDNEPCSAEMTFGMPSPLPGLTAETTIARLSISADELAVVFQRTGSTDLHFAARATTSQAFGAIVSQASSAEFDGSTGISLSPTGTTLVLSGASGRLAELTRANSSALFGAPSTAAFADIATVLNQQNELASGFAVSSFGGVFLRSGQAVPGLFGTTKSAAGYGVGSPLAAPSLMIAPTALKRPTWLSPDGRAVVVANENNADSVFLKRQGTNAALTLALPLPSKKSVHLGVQCDRMVYVDSGRAYEVAQTR
jgi:hypothetical protein